MKDERVASKKDKKPQFKIPLYEEIIAKYLENSNMEVITFYIDEKFKSKDISLSTICEIRTELFNLMVYLESNELYKKDFKDAICIVSENVFIEGRKIKYRL